MNTKATSLFHSDVSWLTCNKEDWRTFEDSEIVTEGWERRTTEKKGDYKGQPKHVADKFHFPQASYLFHFCTPPFLCVLIQNQYLELKSEKKVKSLSRVRLFVTPWTIACTRLFRPWDFPVPKWLAISFSRRSSWPRDRTQGSNPGLPHCRQTLYPLSYHGSLELKCWLILISTLGDLLRGLHGKILGIALCL